MCGQARQTCPMTSPSLGAAGRHGPSTPVPVGGRADCRLTGPGGYRADAVFRAALRRGARAVVPTSISGGLGASSGSGRPPKLALSRSMLWSSPPSLAPVRNLNKSQPRMSGRSRDSTWRSSYVTTLAVIRAGPPQFQQSTSPGDSSGSLPWMSHPLQVYAARIAEPFSKVFTRHHASRSVGPVSDPARSSRRRIVMRKYSKHVRYLLQNHLNVRYVTIWYQAAGRPGTVGRRGALRVAPLDQPCRMTWEPGREVRAGCGIRDTVCLR